MVNPELFGDATHEVCLSPAYTWDNRPLVLCCEPLCLYQLLRRQLPQSQILGKGRSLWSSVPRVFNSLGTKYRGLQPVLHKVRKNQ
jgi:hypothetical protein